MKNSLFKVNDIVRLRNDLTISDFMNYPKKIYDMLISNAFLFEIFYIGYDLPESLNNCFVRVASLINNNYLIVEILESNIHQTLCGLYVCINIKLIDKELLQMLNAENNTEKTLRRHNFKLKNSKFDKSKFFP